MLIWVTGKEYILNDNFRREVASSLNVLKRKGRDAFCQSATYTLEEDGLISVLNQGRKGSVTGEESFIKGTLS